MICKNVLKFFGLLIVILTTQFNQPDNQTINHVVQKYQMTIDNLKNLVVREMNPSQLLIKSFFLDLAVEPKVYLKQLQKDMSFIQKQIKKLKKEKKTFQNLQKFYQELLNLKKYLKKHRLQHDVLWCHHTLKQRWLVLLQAVIQLEDIEPLLKLVGIEAVGREGLKVLIKQIKKEQQKIESFEYRLPSDLIEEKLANYVLKIELIRLRNAALFHPLYKGTKLQLPSTYPR